MSGGKNCFQSNILSAIVVAQGNDKDPCSQYVRLEVRDLFIFAHPWLKRRLWRGKNARECLGKHLSNLFPRWYSARDLTIMCRTEQNVPSAGVMLWWPASELHP